MASMGPTELEEPADINHRWKERHALSDENALVRSRGIQQRVNLINVSSGGAMIEGDLSVNRWEKIELGLGENGWLECAVRWIRDKQVGLEFAHETRIDCVPDKRDALLKEVLRRSFPEGVPAPLASPEMGSADDYLNGYDERVDPIEVDTTGRNGRRHPLIWMADLHHTHGGERSRIRNISESGALVDTLYNYPDGSPLNIDMGEAGTFAATVVWCRNGQTGLSFAKPFDVELLALNKPKVAGFEWVQPDFLRAPGDNQNAWSSHWNRATLSEMQDELDGFMKY